MNEQRIALRQRRDLSEIIQAALHLYQQNFAALFKAARDQAPSVIFIDEIEALAPRRSESRSSVMQRLVPQILAELEGFRGRKEPVLFIGATNEPWSLDPAIKRPGRFDEKIYIGLPDATALQRILEIHLEDRPLDHDVDLRRLAEVLNGYSGADIRNLCRKAADEAFLKSIRGDANSVIDQLTLLRIAQEVKPSVTPEQLKRFHEYHAGGN